MKVMRHGIIWDGDDRYANLQKKSNFISCFEFCQLSKSYEKLPKADKRPKTP